MDNMVKQRVIGAVVLVALVVIFVPMLFEQPADDLGPLGEHLPAQPEPVARDRLEPLVLPEPPADPASGSVVLDEPEQAPEAAAEALSEALSEAQALADPATPDSEPTAAPEPPVEPEPESQPTPSSTASETTASETAESAAPPQPAAVDQAPPAKADQPPPQTPPAAQQPTPASPLSGWVVQVASLSKKDNAMALRERLRQLGYTAFVEEAKTDKGLLFRVRVGPELERASAEQLRDKLETQIKLKGMVTQYP